MTLLVKLELRIQSTVFSNYEYHSERTFFSNVNFLINLFLLRNRHAFSFIKDQVVEATCQCLLAQADEVNRRNINVEDGQKYILEEFGRCLIQIIECAPDKYNPS